MDMFMDKLAQKLTAQEMIKANMAADAEEMNRLKERSKEYSECLEQIRKLTEDSIARINEIKADEAQSEESKEAEMMAALEALKSQIGEKVDASSESIHKECVKVYRNVQAVVVEESNKQTESLKEHVSQAVNDAVKGHSGKLNAILFISVISLILALGSVALHVLEMMNFKLF